MPLFVTQWTENNPIDSFAGLSDTPYSLLFDSARPSHRDSRYSYICWHPFETIEAKNGRVTVTNREQQLSFKANPFDILQERLNLWGGGKERDPTLPPLQGGAAGFFGYDLGRNLERLPAKAQDDPVMPDMAVGLYDQVLAFDHAANMAWLIIHAKDKREANIRRQVLESSLLCHPRASGDHAGITGKEGIAPQWTPDCDGQTYKNKIRTIIDHIHAGEIYQVNISRRFTAQTPKSFDPFMHYRHLREVNPAPYASYMNFGPVKIASASPESFLSLRGKQVKTRPIKGTLSSSKTPDALANNTKDRAENIMIVDLLRNDISKVCESHSVSAPEICAVESFEGLHHLVSSVQGTLQPDKTAIDLLKACFPGGSITGAPKIRAMEIIEDLEPNRRGPYCGALGWIGFHGNMDTSIAIRTLVYAGNKIHLQTGSGIVADSTPEAELQESLLKTEKLFASFEPIIEQKETA